MTLARRAATATGLALAVVVGTGVSGWAAFSDTTSVQQSIGTGTVAAPASYTIDDRCKGRWYEATLTWPASTTSRGVTGYRVMAHLNTGASVVMGETDAATLSVYTKVDKSYLDDQPRVSILTLTSYGWTAETPRSAVLTC